MLDGVTAVLGSAKVAIDLTRGLLDMKEGAAVNEKAMALSGILIELQQHLISTQQEQMQLLKRIDELEKQLTRNGEDAKKRDRYERHQFVTGFVTYRLKADYWREEPEHYICSNCLEQKGSFITLHGKEAILRCPCCETAIRATP
ncbi:hypothetical protein PSCT_01169 [Pseudomonas sp. SCT]|uniref:hypothetical protein n=1 Tax=Pseudomonas sp. (strain SCT) TaxID=412955 RepID=UPI000EF01ABA|nr:hypothetical protein [Pseudomonas sp. SCT]GCA54988.1 hypothetical protein PSCT_01169 [Pseudomonas sp. SCT]